MSTLAIKSLTMPSAKQERDTINVPNNEGNTLSSAVLTRKTASLLPELHVVGADFGGAAPPSVLSHHIPESPKPHQSSDSSVV
jgi:hypothetical protein